MEVKESSEIEEIWFCDFELLTVKKKKSVKWPQSTIKKNKIYKEEKNRKKSIKKVQQNI